MKPARNGVTTTRFARFAGAAAAALTATEVTLTVCNGVFHLTSTPAALLSWFAGAVVSYVFSRWAWERKGRPDVLRETLPFWAISASVIVLLTLANKLGEHGVALEAGHLVLAGSFTRVVFAKRGDTIHGDFGPLGSVAVQFI